MQEIIDLSTLAKKDEPEPDPGFYKHRWIMMAKFVVPTETLDLMVEQHKLLDEGKVTEVNVNVPLNPENLLRIDGPGCIKCNTQWEPGNSGDNCLFGDDGKPNPIQQAKPQLLVAQRDVQVQLG